MARSIFQVSSVEFSPRLLHFVRLVRVGFELAGSSSDYFQSPFAPSLPLVQTDKHGYNEVQFGNLGMLQLHPEKASPLFHHRTSGSKFIPNIKQTEARRAMTHLTPPVNTKQASLMLFGTDKYTLLHAPIGAQGVWGLETKDADVYECKDTGGCSMQNLQHAYQKYWGMNEASQWEEPSPLMVLEVPKDSDIYRYSVAGIQSLSEFDFVVAEVFPTA